LSWPDSRPEGFEWRCGDTLVRVHDWYRVPTFLSIPEKLARATRVLLPREGEKAGDWENGAPPALALTFLSASAIPLALPPTIARGFGWPALGLGVEGVNARFVRWLLQHLAGAAPGDAASAMPRDAAGAGSTATLVAPVPVPPAPARRVRGWVLCDYFADPRGAIVPLLLELNMHGRVAGEEGWP
jgi:1-phosphatidylinositol phosphodiesterase